jgi:acyl dehydratase
VRVFNGLAELRVAKGERLGTSDWVMIDQERIDGFAALTEDHQWIHVDADRAAAGPYGRTIAHGFLTLSLCVSLYKQVFRIDGVRMGLNYGLGKVRFPAPLPVGTRVRAEVVLADVSEVDGGVQMVIAMNVEAEGIAKPVCVAELISRQYD